MYFISYVLIVYYNSYLALWLERSASFVVLIRSYVYVVVQYNSSDFYISTLPARKSTKKYAIMQTITLFFLIS